MEFNLIFAIVPADNQKAVVDATKKAGATGATLLSARGAGAKDAKTFFGLTLDRPQEAIILLAEKSMTQKIMQAMYDAADMEKPGNGICWSSPAENVMGLESQLPILTKKLEGNK